ncbi:MAG TPA: hypothetical protein VIJ50_09220 [Solirubrobacteraceae bacterium]
MSPSETRNGHEADSIPEGGILAALPRARPQRASARRAAARTSASARKGRTAAKTATTTKTTQATKAQGARPAANKKPVAGKRLAAAGPAAAKATAGKATAGKATAGKPVATDKAGSTKRGGKKPVSKPAEPKAPKQGYEPEEELELGKSVNPPSGAELVESVADIIGELANSGLTAGGRLLKDAFSLLRRP